MVLGDRFAPTGVELINHYLKKKILGDISLINAIREVRICNYEPKFLPPLSKIRSKDPTWYFFSLKEYTSEKKNSMKRATDTGFWKVTGVDRKIKDKGIEIGIKKTLMYYEGRSPNGVKTDWVMHEYHITSLPTDQRTHVICKVMYKGEDENILSGGYNNSSGSSHSLVSESSNLSTMLEICPAISPQLQVEQPAEEENLYGVSVNHLTMPTNQHVDLSPLNVLGTNTFNNNNHNIQLQAPYLSHEFEDGLGPSMQFNDNNTFNMQPQTPYSTQDVEENWSPWQRSNTARVISNTPTQVEQPIEEENLNGLSVNHLAMIRNEHVDLSLLDVLGPNTFSDDNNNNPSRQLLAPYLANEFEYGYDQSMWFNNNNNTLSMQPQTPYSTQDVDDNVSPWQHSNTIRATSNTLSQVEQGEETHSHFDILDTNTFFSDYDNYNPNME